jgi:hypothetical protein
MYIGRTIYRQYVTAFMSTIYYYTGLIVALTVNEKNWSACACFYFFNSHHQNIQIAMNNWHAYEAGLIQHNKKVQETRPIYEFGRRGGVEKSLDRTGEKWAIREGRNVYDAVEKHMIGKITNMTWRYGVPHATRILPYPPPRPNKKKYMGLYIFILRWNGSSKHVNETMTHSTHKKYSRLYVNCSVQWSKGEACTAFFLRLQTSSETCTSSVE